MPMTRWDQSRYEQERETFIQRRVNLAPLWSQFTLVFAATWGAAWLCSWLLLREVAPAHAWARSLPGRYAVAFLFAYACFFLAVRIWIETARQEPERQGEPMSDVLDTAWYAGDVGEGCLPALAVMLLGFIVGGLFLAVGGAPMLLEAAFEAAFAGVVVSRPLRGTRVLGDWKAHLLASTWKQAAFSLAVLLAVATVLQSHAPQATTFAQAVRAISHHNATF